MTERMDSVFEGKEPGDPVELPLDLFWRGSELGLAHYLPGPDVRADSLSELQWGWGVTAMRVDRRQIPEAPFFVTLTFNLALPMEPQLKLAEDILKDARRQLDAAGAPKLDTPKVRVRLDRWTSYLRLLDARNAGVSIAEMGRTVYAKQLDPRGSAQDALRRAEKLSESGYFQLILKGEKPQRGGN